MVVHPISVPVELHLLTVLLWQVRVAGLGCIVLRLILTEEVMAEALQENTDIHVIFIILNMMVPEVLPLAAVRVQPEAEVCILVAPEA